MGIFDDEDDDVGYDDDDEYMYTSAEQINEAIKTIDGDGDRVEYIKAMLDGICPHCGTVDDGEEPAWCFCSPIV